MQNNHMGDGHLDKPDEPELPDYTESMTESTFMVALLEWFSLLDDARQAEVTADINNRIHAKLAAQAGEP